MDFNKSYNRESFIEFLNVGQNAFLPDDFMLEEEELDFTAKRIKRVTRIGICSSLGLEVFEVQHNSYHDARVELSKESFRLLMSKSTLDRALIIFVPEKDYQNYRLSLIHIDCELDENKVRTSYSNPRRYSFVLGKDAKVRTPKEYLIKKGTVKDWDDLQHRFSVEVLTKEFYQELSDWYAWAINIIRFPNDINNKSENIQFNSECTIRLITRLIFVWFLKQRHLIPDEFFDEDYISQKLIYNFNPHAIVDLFGKSDESKYYKAILQNLFFAMLNSPITSEGKDIISERHFRHNRSDFDNNKLMRYKDYFINPELFVDIANKTVPFLNGGLFDCLDDKSNHIYYDGFSDRDIVKKSLIVPDYLFFGEEVGKNIDLSEWYGDSKKRKVSTRGIIDILKRYNFTVEENTPFDIEVSLDPELLGKVFENLLASYNPETKSTARKQTGSFYTPREIVQYMVDESIISHLKNTVGENLEEKYRLLLQYNDDEIIFSDLEKENIIKALYNCRILDPACGSGAFPMGILQQMVHILNRIDSKNVQWRKMMLDNAINETSNVYRTFKEHEREEQIADIKRSFDENFNRPDYARKLYLIENCIFGVDIQSIAIQISKLRFFISLVVDQKINSDPIDNFGIRPLPNLEAKFVAANTLVGLIKNEIELFDSEEINRKEEELKSAKHKIFSAKTYKTKRKYKNKVAKLRMEISRMLESRGYIGNNVALQLANWDMFDQNTTSPFFDPEWMFGIKDGFDIVIGNPPYLKEGRASKSVFDGVRLSDYYQGKMDLWYMFACLGIDFLKKNGLLCFIATNNWVTNSGASKLRNKVVKETTIKQLCDFSNFMIFESASIQTMVMLFEKNAEKDNYFVDYRKLKGDTKLSDAIALLKKIQLDNVEYFSPKFIRKNYYNKYILFGSNVNILDKITNLQNITKLKKSEISQGIVYPQDFLNSKNQKILGDNYTIGQGIFVLNKIEIKRLNLNDSEYNLLRPLYTTKEIHRYYINKRNEHSVIYTDSSYKDVHSMDSYPNMKNHLDLFSKIITSSNKPYGLHRSRNENIFKGEKIIVLRKCVAKPIFSYSDFDCYVSSTFNIIRTDRISIKFLLALLNSKLVQFWLKNQGKMQGNNYQLDQEPLLNIPIILPSAFVSNIVEKLIDYILWLNNDSNNSINEFIDNYNISIIIEDIINALILELYFIENFKSASIEILKYVNVTSDMYSFCNNISKDNKELLNQIKLMKIKLKDLVMPILSI